MFRLHKSKPFYHVLVGQHKGVGRSGCIIPLIFNFDVRWKMVVSFTLQPLCLRGNYVPITFNMNFLCAIGSFVKKRKNFDNVEKPTPIPLSPGPLPSLHINWATQVQVPPLVTTLNLGFLFDNTNVTYGRSTNRLTKSIPTSTLPSM